jgi:hypothetical protein
MRNRFLNIAPYTARLRKQDYFYCLWYCFFRDQSSVGCLSKFAVFVFVNGAQFIGIVIRCQSSEEARPAEN